MRTAATTQRKPDFELRPLAELHEAPKERPPRSDAFLKAREWRAALLQRLKDEGEWDLVNKLIKCGVEVRFRCTACSQVHVGQHACHLKWCPVCARSRAAQRVAKYAKASRLMKWPLHVTLTIVNTDTITIEHVRALKQAFKRLRRTKIWATNVVGGIVSIELTNKGNGWHLHLHTLIDCEWLALETPKLRHMDSREKKHAKCQAASKELEETWNAQIGQAQSSTDVRRCSGDVAVIEVLKYAVPAKDLVECQGKIGDAIRAISGGRLCTPFGSLFGLKKELRDDEKPGFECPRCGEVKTLLPEEIWDRLMMSGGLDMDSITHRFRNTTGPGLDE